MGDVSRTLQQVGNASIFGQGGGSFLGQAGSFLGMGGADAVNTQGFAPSGQEMAFTNALMGQYMGTGGPSAAALQMQQGLGMANNNAMALAASQRGINPALAAMQAQKAQAMNDQNVTAQSGIMRAQEQMNAANTLGGMYSSQRQSAGEGNKLSEAANQASYKRKNDMLSSVGAAFGMAEGGMAGAPPQVAKLMEKFGGGGEDPFAQFLSLDSGGKVPGHAPAPGDSSQNDVVPAMLSPGEMVVPRSVVSQGPEAIAHFARTLMGC